MGEGPSPSTSAKNVQPGTWGTSGCCDGTSNTQPAESTGTRKATLFEPRTKPSAWRCLHSLKLTQALKMVVANRNLLFQGSIFRGYVSFRGVIMLVGTNSGWIWNQPIPSISWSIGSFLEGCPLPPRKAVPEYLVVPAGFVRRSINRIDARCYSMPALLGQMEPHLRLD